MEVGTMNAAQSLLRVGSASALTSSPEQSSAGSDDRPESTHAGACFWPPSLKWMHDDEAAQQAAQSKAES